MAAAGSPTAVGPKAGSAIQFIGTEIDAKGNEKFIVNQDAVDYLNTLTGRLAIVSIAGETFDAQWTWAWWHIEIRRHLSHRQILLDEPLDEC